MWNLQSSSKATVVVAAAIVAIPLVYILWQKARHQGTARRISASMVQVLGDDEGKHAAAQTFEMAAAWVSEHGSGLSTSAALELYAWYKQATCGDCQGSQPFSMQGAAKWDAWNQVRGYEKEVAQLAYVKALEQYAPEWTSGGALEETGASPDRGDGLSMGPAVSTLGCIGPGNPADVDETPAGQLCQKIADGAVEEACALLRQFPKLAIEVDKDGMLPLHWAADRGDVEMVNFLLDVPDVKAHISKQDEGGDTPLHYAVMSENETVAKLLVCSGADANIPNEAGETPAELAKAGGLALG